VTVRAQRVLAIALGVFTLAALLNYPMRFAVPFLGAFPFATAPDGTVTDVDKSWDQEVRKTQHLTLAVGDRIEWEKVPLDDRYGSMRRPLAGRVVSYPFLHDGVERRIRAVAYAMDYPQPAVKTLPAVKHVCWIFFVLLALTIVFKRPSPMTWGFYVYALGNRGDSAAGLSFLPAIPFYAVQFGVSFLSFASAVGLMEFALRFPEDRTEGWRRAIERTVPILLGACAVVAAWITYREATVSITWDLETNLHGIGPLPFYAVAWISLIGCYRRSKGIDRLRLRWAIVGVFFGTLVMGWTLPILAAGATKALWLQYPDEMQFLAVQSLSTLAYIVVPLTLGYAIVRHRVIDVEFVVNRAIALGAIAALLGGIFVLLDWLFTNYVLQTRWQTAIGMAVAFALGWLVRSERRRLIDLVDALFFRKRHAIMGRVRALRLDLEIETQPERIDETIVTRAAEVLNLDSAALFVRTTDGGFVRQSAVGWPSGTAWHLFSDDRVVSEIIKHDRRAARIGEKTWAAIRVPDGVARPVLAVPIGSARSAFALYGAHADGRDIDPDETRGLFDLCAAAAAIRAA
jgi:hypothetical protein